MNYTKIDDYTIRWNRSGPTTQIDFNHFSYETDSLYIHDSETIQSLSILREHYLYCDNPLCKRYQFIISLIISDMKCKGETNFSEYFKRYVSESTYFEMDYEAWDIWLQRNKG